MGVTLHYSGRLRAPADAARVVAEIVDIAETLGWPFQTIDSEETGVSVQPHPQCEGFLLLFDAQGTIRNPVLESGGFFCKTQFAPASVHVALVKLLRHLGKRWFAELTVIDEGGYWETGDLEELERRRREVERGLRQVEGALRGAAPGHPEESEGDLASRIERILTEHQGRPIELTKEEKQRVLGSSFETEKADPEEDPAWQLGMEFVKQFTDRVPDDQAHPAVDYVLSLAHATLAGVYVALAGAGEDDGSPRELEARRRLAVERFQTIARLLRRFPAAGLEALASGADKVARAFSDR